MTRNVPSTEPAAAPTRREVATIVFLSALVHAGVAGAAYSAPEPQPTLKRVSRVAIDVARRPAPPPRVTPPLVPPPPPKVVKREAKALAPPIANQALAPSEPAPLSSPVDTGSSAPAAADGELFAGSGGLGTAAAPPPAPPSPPAPQLPAPVVQAREGANYARNPRPAYPGRARREGWEGTTLLRVRVSPSGKPGSIQIQRSSGRDLLDAAARAAVEKWTFVPATQGGVAVAGWVTVPIVFRLQ